MNGLDPLAEALRSERDALAGSAPAPEFPALWREVETRRERGLQRLLVLAAAVPTVLLFLGGVASLLLGGGVLAGLPLLAVALWLAVDGVVLNPLAAGERRGPPRSGGR
jgi:hypothetical protein